MRHSKNKITLALASAALPLAAVPGAAQDMGHQQRAQQHMQQQRIDSQPAITTSVPDPICSVDEYCVRDEIKDIRS